MKMILKRLVILLSCLAILTGCTKVSEDVEGEVTRNIEQALLLEAEDANSLKPYYSFYLEPSIGRVSSTETGNIFSYQGMEFLMNLNISSILNTDEEKTVKVSENLNDYLVDQEGSYFDAKGESHVYQVRVLQKEESFLTSLHTDVVDFYAISDQSSIGTLSGIMMKIARSVNVDKEAVAEGFTSGKKLNYHSEKVQLFESIAPEKGVVEELFNNSTTAGTEIDVTNGEEEGGKQFDTDDFE